MSAASDRRMTAEVAWDRDPGAILWVGARPLHQYWPLLAPYFRDLLLPPHRRSDAENVSWTWEPAAAAQPLEPRELATVRKRLAHDQRLFAEHVESAHAAEAHRQAGIDRLAEAMAENVRRLAALGDAELAAFVCRTEAGLRVHSWAATIAATPVSAETRAAAEKGGGNATPASKPRRSKRRGAWLVIAGTAVATVFAVMAWGRATRTKPRREIASADPRENSSATVAKTVSGSEAPAVPASASAEAKAGVRPSRSRPRDELIPRSTPPTAETRAQTAALATATPTQTTVEKPIVVAASVLGAPAPSGQPLPAVGPPVRPAGGETLNESPTATAARNVAPLSFSDVERVAAQGPTSQPRATTDSVAAIRVASVNAGTSPPPDADSERETDHAAITADAPRDTTEPRVATAFSGAMASVAAPTRERAPDFPRELRWPAGRWAVHLVDDRIVPTQPRRAGGARTAETQRAALMAEMRAAQPAAFRQPRFRYGATFETPAGRRAELGWSEGGDEIRAGRLAMSDGGVPLAFVTLAPDGAVLLRCLKQVHVRCWVELSNAANETTRFEWRTGSGFALSRGPRFEMLVADDAVAVELAGRALVDRLSGWAIVLESK
jgi:hypothetical protein